MKNTKSIVYSALFAALVYVATMWLHIPIPGSTTGEYVHLGNAVIFLASIFLFPAQSAAAAVIGSLLADLSYPQWWLSDIIIKAIMALIVYRFGRTGKIKDFAISTAAAGLFAAIGYTITQVVLISFGFQEADAAISFVILRSSISYGVELVANTVVAIAIFKVFPKNLLLK